MISSLPALALGVSALITALPRPLAAAALASAVAALGLGAAGMFEKDTQRPAYEEAAAFLESHARPGDVVLEFNISHGPPARTLAVQLEPGLPLFRLGEEPDALRAAGRSGGRVFYVHPELAGLRKIGPIEVGRSFRVVDRRTWDGVYPLTVVVYEPR